MASVGRLLQTLKRHSYVPNIQNTDGNLNKHTHSLHYRRTLTPEYTHHRHTCFCLWGYSPESQVSGSPRIATQAEAPMLGVFTIDTTIGGELGNNSEAARVRQLYGNIK